MEITGTQQIPAPRDAVWNALNDPVVLKQCLPGCESVERTSANEFKVQVATAIGPLRARFNGTLRITQADPPASCVMVFEGQGGAVGFGKGSSSVSLREVPDGTELTYSAKAQVGGKLAQVGSRLIDNVARKMADDFFKAFRAQLSPAAPAAPMVPAAPKAVVRAEAVDAPAALRGHSGAAAASQAPVATLVPGWWLVVAALVGAGASLAGSMLVLVR